jgi:hypothetical protein
MGFLFPLCIVFKSPWPPRLEGAGPLRHSPAQREDEIKLIPPGATERCPMTADDSTNSVYGNYSPFKK